MECCRKVIYMADDDADDRYYMRQSLQKMYPALTIVEAEDGCELLALLEAWSEELVYNDLDLILLDINMPKLNGLETLAAIKKNPLTQHIPIVIVSTSDEPEMMVKAYLNGASGYVKKPDNYARMDQVAQVVYSFCSGVVAKVSN